MIKIKRGINHICPACGYTFYCAKHRVVHPDYADGWCSMDWYLPCSEECAKQLDALRNWLAKTIPIKESGK